jgi:integrase
MALDQVETMRHFGHEHFLVGAHDRGGQHSRCTARPVLRQSLLDYRKSETEDALVFAGRNGKPLDAKNVLRQILKPTCARLELPPITWHSFRHTHAIGTYA